MTIPELKAACANSAHSRYYFSPDTMRFFNSVLHGVTFTAPNDPSGRTWFITSEQFDDDSARYYSVRVFDPAEGEVSTVGSFQEHETFEAAVAAAKFVAGVA